MPLPRQPPPFMLKVMRDHEERVRREEMRKALEANRGRPWIQQENFVLLACYQAGEGVELMMEQTGRTKKAILTHLSRLGLNARKCGMSRDSEEDGEAIALAILSAPLARRTR